MAIPESLGGVQSPALFCIQSTGGDSPKSWPYGYNIKARLLDDVHPFVQTVLKYTLTGWLGSEPLPQVNVTWVQGGDSEVRFGMSSGVTFCALGPDAKNIPPDKPTAVLALKKWNSGTCEVVWDVVEIERMANHVWGHVFGLPHAYDKNSDWNLAKLDQICEPNGLPRVQICNLSGCSQLNASDSIMHFDRPTDLVSTPVLHNLNTKVDKASAELLASMYPLPPEVDCFQVICSEFPDWQGAESTGKKTHEVLRSTNCTKGQKISALTYIDLAPTGKYQASILSDVSQDGKGLRIQLGSWDEGTKVWNLKAMILSFAKWQAGIQTGYAESSDLRSKNWNASGQGEKFSKRIEFSKAFDSTPDVVTFIFRFSMDGSTWVRMATYPTDIDKNGFTIHLDSWADTKAHDIGAWWLAHEAKHPMIRSGRFNPPEHPYPNWGTEDRKRLPFTSPFVNKPRFIFCGFDHANTQNGVTIRFQCEAENWDKEGVDMKISTWFEESRYHSMGASYVALL